MINKHSKGKEHTRRPLPVRAIAILMAFAMVLSVLYINNRREVVVKAEGEIVEDAFLAGKMTPGEGESFFTKNDGVTEVVVPVDSTSPKQVEFKLPDLSGYTSTSTPEEVTLYQYGTAGAYSYKTTSGEGATEVLATRTSSVTYAWNDGTSDVTTVASAATVTSNTVKVYSTTTYSYSVGETAVSVDGNTPTKTETNVSVKISTRATNPVSVSNSLGSVNVTDADIIADATKVYNYGNTPMYAVSADSTAPADDAYIYTVSGLFDYLNGTSVAEGTTVNIYKKLVNGSGTTICSTFVPVSVTKNTAILSSFGYLDADNNLVAGTEESGNKVITINNASCKNSIAIQYTTDVALKSTVTPTTGEGYNSPLDGQNDTATAVTDHGFVIPAEDASNGKIAKYTVNVSDGELSDSFTVTVNYADGTPTVTGSIATSGSTIGGVTYYGGDGKISINASASVDSSVATIGSMEIVETNSSGTPVGESGQNQSIAITAGQSEITNASAEYILKPGTSYFKVVATSSLGFPGSSDVMTAYYDNVGPKVTNVGLKQTISDGTNTKNFAYNITDANGLTTTQSFGASEMVSCKKDAYLEFTASDACGIKSVKCGEETVNPDGGVYKYKITAKDGNNNQTIPYTFTFTDILDNETSLTVNVNFFNDNVVIERSIAETSDESATYVPGVSGFLTWHDSDISKTPGDRKFSIIYTITVPKSLDTNSKIMYHVGDDLDASSQWSTVSSTDYTLDTSDATNNVYKVKKNYTGVSAKYENIRVSYINDNYVRTDSELLSVLYIDSDAPETSVSALTLAPVIKIGSADGEDVDATKWYKKDLILHFTFKDKNGETASGISGVKNVSGVYGDVTNLGNGSFLLTVDQSTGPGPDEADYTNVKFDVVDNVGNQSNYSGKFKVDWTPPKSNLKISGLTIEDGVEDTNLYNISSIPSIEFSPSDKPSGVASYTATISDGTSSVTLNEASTSLTTYFSDLNDSKEYTVSVTVTDNAGYTSVTSKKFKVDGTKPVVSVVVDDPAAPTKGINPYYNTDVKVKLTIKDTNIDESTVQIYDNEDPITVSWDKTNPSEWIGYYTATTPGSHTIKLTAKDDSQNAPDPEFATNTFVLDKEAPVIKTFLDDEEYNGSGAYKLSSATSKMTVTDDYSRDEADEKVTVKLVTPTGETKTEVKNGDGPFTFAEDGVYTLTYEATDKAGNPASKEISFTVDGSKPVHNIYVSTGAAKSSKYSNEYSNKVGKFENEEYTYGKYFNTDVFLDVAYFDYNMASVTVYDNDVPVDVTWSKDGAYGRGTIAISSEGYHEIKMSSEDYSGNKVTDSGSSAVYFTIDKTAPVLTTYLDGEAYADTTAHREKAIAQVGVADDNPDEDDISITVERQPNSGASETTIYYGLNGLEYTLDGYYTVTYNVSDKAGNPANISCGFTIDNTAPVHNMYVLTDNPAKFSSYKNNYNNPVGVFASRPSQESYEYGQYYGSDVSVELNVYDYNLDWVYVTDNGAEISPSWTWDGPYGKAVVTLSSEGYHELKMWSKDLSGNETEDTEVGQKVRLYVDKTSPSITTYVNSSLYTEGSGVRYLNTNASVSVSVNDANKDSTDLVRASKMTPPGGSSSSQTDNIGETTENYSTEADYEVTYVATDLAGNKSATRNVQFRVDKTPPQLSITGDGTSTAKSVAVSFGIKEAFYWDMTSAKYSIYKKAEGTAEALEKTVDFTPRSANDSQSYTITDDAEYRFEFSAEDKCGNKTEMKGTLIKDGTAPVIMLSGVSNYDKTDKNVTLNISVDEAFYSSNKVTLTGTRTDIDGKKTNIDFNQFVTNRTKISNLEQLFEEDGIYDITVTSTDKAGNTSSKSLHFTIDTTDPEIGDLSKYDGVKTNKFEWDIDLDDLVKDLTVCDISVYMDGSLYDGTSEISDGSHVLRVEAVDELGHKSFKEVTFVLDTKGPNIIISNVEDGDRLLESTDVTVTVEIDEDILDTVSLNDKAVTVTDNKATFTVNAKGKYKINATAHDEAGNMSSTEIQFSFGKQMNIKLIAIIAGAAILLLILLLVLIKRRRDNAYY